MKDFKSIYKATVLNDEGLNGIAKVTYPEAWEIETSSPNRTDLSGANPEQLLGLSLATCLNSTVQAELGRRKLEKKSSVEIDLHLAKIGDGYEFFLDAKVKIPNVSTDEAKEVLEIAERRCPVSKLLKKGENINIELDI